MVLRGVFGVDNVQRTLKSPPQHSDAAWSNMPTYHIIALNTQLLQLKLYIYIYHVILYIYIYILYTFTIYNLLSILIFIICLLFIFITSTCFDIARVMLCMPGSEFLFRLRRDAFLGESLGGMIPRSQEHH